MLVPPLDERLKPIMHEVCEEHQAEIEALEVMPDHVHLLVSGRSSRCLRQECPVVKRQVPTVWTISYCVRTTGERRSRW